MAKRYINKNDVIVFDTLDNLVPDDHLVRKLDEFVDWSFIYELTDFCIQIWDVVVLTR